MHEKQNVIKPGVTPPESDEKQASAQLVDHPTTRLAEAVKDSISDNSKCSEDKPA